ncbi:MAG: hypothetical protein HPY50_02945 [Firmicutes bacterium]|nr:hypothetical protein [Bacillota bacterium]
MKKIAIKVKEQITGKALTVKVLLLSQRGENFVDSAIRILIAVVIGGLLLAGLYTLFGDTVLPTLTERIEEMFNYGN